MKLEFDIEKLVELADYNHNVDASGYPTNHKQVEGAEVNGVPIHSHVYWDIRSSLEPDRTWIEVYLGDAHNIYVRIDVENAEKAAGQAALEEDALKAQEAEARSHHEAELKSAAMRETARHYGFGAGQ